MADVAARDELVRALAAAVRAAQLYTAGHPIVARSAAALAAVLDRLHAHEALVTIGLVGDHIVVQDAPIARTATFMEFMARLRASGIERITFDRAVTTGEVAAFAASLAAQTDESFAHIRVGRLQLAGETETPEEPAVPTVRQAYGDAVSMAADAWQQSAAGHTVDPAALRAAIDNLALEVARNRTALLALTAIKQYDDYTLTHMVNVSILTMAQARSLGLEGAALREVGLAALMHDIGKVHTPAEILTKPDRLTPAEFAVMKQHPVHGAEMLRATPEMPTLPAIVAFEHHLRLDGTGYPEGVSRPALNAATMLCSIADVYDAMRSQRQYQQAFPTDRILAVLQRNDGQQFDQRLVRRFTQIMGIYPPGSLVRLDTGAIAIVRTPRAVDPYRPRVRLLLEPDRTPLVTPMDWDLSEAAGRGLSPSAVLAPADPDEYGIDVLEQL
ncbi:MAG TPA: HD-GYP domain-containing protein [Vicinamibacterales bacterium]|jgi:putative nucleotidyltransferase with HDIG domain